MSFLKKGKDTEEMFANLFSNYRKSTKQQDINEHWDLEIPIKVDIKGMKKVKRSDSEPNQNYHWVEVKNVHGNLGWLYGLADFFAFELEDFWVIVSKENLQKMIAEKVTKTYYDEPTIYGLYQRKGRSDVLTIVPSYDLCAISTAMIQKNGQEL